MSRTVDRLPKESQDDSQSTHVNLWYEFEIDLDPLRSYDLWWKMRIWNDYRAIELGLNDNMIYQMKKHISKWIYSKKRVLITCLTDTSMFILSLFANTMLCMFFNGFVFRVNPYGTSTENGYASGRWTPVGVWLPFCLDLFIVFERLLV